MPGSGDSNEAASRHCAKDRVKQNGGPKWKTCYQRRNHAKETRKDTRSQDADNHFNFSRRVFQLFSATPAQLLYCATIDEVDLQMWRESGKN